MSNAAASGRRRILTLTSTFPRWPGDACPMFVADLCDGLADRFDVTVLAPGSRGALSQERRNNVTIRRYRYGWPAGFQQLADGAILPNLKRNRLLIGQVPALVLAQLWAAWRLVGSGAVDVLHAHWVLPQGWVAALVGERAGGVPVLTTAHGGDLYALRASVPLALKRWTLQRSDRVTAVSSSLKREVVALGVAEERVHVLPMGVDTKRFSPEAATTDRGLDPTGPNLLFVGRLVEKKGARYAIEAMPQVLRHEPDARLSIAGDGPERESLERLSDDRGLQDRVTFLGAVPHDRLPALYASADVFVGPSVVEANGDTESFGVVFAEAMASGCPVVASDVGGVADLVIDGETGVLVPERDAGAIADAVVGLVRDEGRRERFSSNGVAWAQHRFDLRTTTARYGDLIEELAA
jgi:glycosyltransferase involved in cell wall biosynthesis